MENVKQGALPYRKQRARATRRKIVEAARRLFTEQGYQVTMAVIAAEAGVAVQTVYFVFHTKAELLREAISYAATGQHDAAPVMERPWIAEAMRAEDGRRTLALSIEHGTDIFAGVASLTGALEAAAQADPEIAGYVRAIDEARHEGISMLIRAVADKGWLRDGFTIQRAADIMFTVHGDPAYRILVGQCGWSPVEYKAWQYETLCQQLLRDPGPGSENPDPTEGLTFQGIRLR